MATVPEAIVLLIVLSLITFMHTFFLEGEEFVQVGLSMSLDEVIGGDLFETETVVPLVVDSFDKVPLERLHGILFPEVFHLVNGALRQVSLTLDTLVGVDTNLLELLGAENLV